MSRINPQKRLSACFFTQPWWAKLLQGATEGLLMHLQGRQDGLGTRWKVPDIFTCNSIVSMAGVDGGEVECWDLSSCKVLALAAEEARSRASPVSWTYHQPLHSIHLNFSSLHVWQPSWAALGDRFQVLRGEGTVFRSLEEGPQLCLSESQICWNAPQQHPSEFYYNLFYLAIPQLPFLALTKSHNQRKVKKACWKW